jgi:sporulation integral membrane protein YtvI
MSGLVEKADKLFLFFLAYTIIFEVFFRTLNYTLPFVLAFICAAILKKPTQYLMKRFKMKNSTASLITTIIFFAIILSLMTWGLTALAQEAILLGKNASVYISGNLPDLNDMFNKIQKYYRNIDPSITDNIKTNISDMFSRASSLAVSITRGIVKGIINFATSIPYIIMVILFTLLTTYFFTRDMSQQDNILDKLLAKEKSDKVAYIFNETKRMLINYLLSYLLIISITFVETIIVFKIFGVRYAILLSIICAIFDILPILGIGTVYIPLAIIYFLLKNYVVAFGLIISYAIVSIVRQLIEPKIVSSSLGIHPVAVLAALFIGLKANGISGMFFCIFLVVFYNVFKKVNVL